MSSTPVSYNWSGKSAASSADHAYRPVTKSTWLILSQRLNPDRFFKGEPPVDGSVELTQRRVFIFPTLRGFGMAATILLLLLIAIVYNNNLVYFFDFLLASIFFVTILHTFITLADLVVEAGQASPAFVGDAVGFPITVTNPGNRDRASLSAGFEDACDFILPGCTSRTIILYTPARQRGWQTMQTVTISSCYPLGIFRAWSPVRFAGKAMVYPRPAPTASPFPVGKGRNDTGQERMGGTGVDDFGGLRAYQNGDSLRQIHWQAYAKGQGVYSKLYANTEVGNEIWLDYDSTPGGGIEERLSHLCRWVIDAEQAGMKYGLRIPGTQITPASGQLHYQACLEAMAIL